MKKNILAGAVLAASNTVMIRAANHDEIRKECKKLSTEAGSNKFIQQKMQGKRRVY